MIWVQVLDRLVSPGGSCVFYSGTIMSGDGPYELFASLVFEPKHVYDITTEAQPPQPIAEVYDDETRSQGHS